MSYPAPTSGIGTPARIVISNRIVQLRKGSAQLKIGQTFQIEPLVVDTAGTIVEPSERYTYFSRNRHIASVSADGLIVAHAVGETEIQAQHGGLHTTARVYVIAK